MESRINLCLNRCRAEKRSALVVYATVGCPTPEESEVLIDRLIDAGADMIELGVPFSDPMADGPVIQRAGQVALKAGTTLPKILEIATRIRAAHPETPLVLFPTTMCCSITGSTGSAERLKKPASTACLS